MDKVGADTARWYFYTINQPGEYKNFSMKDVESKLKGFVFTLQNCIRFYELYFDPEVKNADKRKNKNLLDQWIISRLNGLFSEVTDSLDKYDPTTAAREIDKFVMEDLSNWWLRRSRKRKEALDLLRIILLELAKILSPFTPFIAEDINQRLKGEGESVHLNDWPEADKKMINKKLEEEMDEARNAVTSGLAVRKEKQIKVRQPLRSATIKRDKKFQEDIEELVKEELNVKGLAYDKAQESAVNLDVELDAGLVREGYIRELIRQIQDMRKEAKYKLDEKIFCEWHSDDSEVSSAIHEWTEEIKKEALLEKFVASPKGNKVYDVEKEFDLAPNKKIWIGVRK
jgi:isoleucyl-tRNA synthetase